MGLFSSKTERELVQRLDEQAALIAGLQKAVRDLEVEWEDYFEKFRNLYARINKRRQREATEAEEASAPVQGINPLAQRLLDLSKGGTG